MKRFNDKKYLEHMTEREIEQWKELRAQIQRIHSPTFLALISRYADHRRDREWELSREREKKEHIARMRALSVGTRVLVIRGEKKGQIGTVKGHGRKYIHVDFGDKYDYWRMRYTWVTDKFDKEDIERAQRDKRIEDKLNPVFNQILSDMGY